MSLILGLNAYHGDSAACLVRDGKLVAAAEEERFRRLKHWSGLPTEAIRYCLREAGATPKDLTDIAVNRKPNVNVLRRIGYILAKRPSPALILSKIRNLRKAAGLREELLATFPAEPISGQFHHIEHHFAHLASSFYVSHFDRAVAVSVDAMGDFASAAWGMGQRNQITVDGRVYSPHSLGIFYSAITQHIGFPHFGDEYKVMGLAPYGEPKYLQAMRQIVLVQPDGTFRLNLKYFCHHRENFTYTWNNTTPDVGPMYTSALDDLLGPARQKTEPLEQRHKDIARSAQAMYEEAFFALLNALHKKYDCPNLALAGGCAMNSVANGKVYSRTPFKKMYLPAAAGDAGGAIGSAYAVWHQTNLNARQPMDHAYWGPSADTAALDRLLQQSADQIKKENCQIEKFADFELLCSQTAQAISEGKVIGWFQGRMEWGPRALGNRSILGDPRRADMKDILNQKIKRRESFRPFAPSILREAVAEWFETDDDVPFMMQVFQVRKEKRTIIPAVTHVDGSGRLQTVCQSTNPRYHRLIEHFRRITNVPLVLNTSFNENEPVVCLPEEALDCFLRTKMDYLILGDYLIRRS